MVVPASRVPLFDNIFRLARPLPHRTARSMAISEREGMMPWRTMGLVVLAGGLLAGVPEQANAQLSAEVHLSWYWGDDGAWRPRYVTPEPREVYYAPPLRERRVAVPRVRVPPGHLPPPGLCRLWYPGRPPGHQPPPAPCGQLFRLYRQPGVVILGGSGYGGPGGAASPVYRGPPAGGGGYGYVVNSHPGRGRGLARGKSGKAKGRAFR